MNDPNPHPESIGQYKVLRHIGTGAFGHGYLVQPADGQEFVAKLLRPDHAEGGELRYKNEIWALRKLEHRCIPKLIDSGEHEGRPYIVMTYAKGETLRALHHRQVEEQVPISQLRVLTIGEEILDALEYMHAQGICHRDVKDDNVVVNRSASDVMLIDLGVCKGQGQPVKDITFWHAGASRFSPPSKLQHPGEAKPTHDVFAVGVLGYLLLTNKFPWSVGAGEDRGHLEKQMQQSTPAPIHQLNPFVDREVSDYFGRLIDIDDRHRMDASQALQLLRSTREKVEERKVPSVFSKIQKIAYPRVIRDPIHGDIVMTEFEWRIMASQEFQRLRRIRQLGFGHLVFPGAEHTRFSHALGTMHVADRIVTRIEQRTGIPFDNEERLTARAFALIHDVTHLTFGHTLEDELNIFERHDRNYSRMSRLVLSDRSELSGILGATEYGRAILAHLDPDAAVDHHSWLRELVDAPVGADVLDYVDRDSYFCGLDHKVDSAIYRRYSIQSRSGTPTTKRHLIARLYGRHGFRLDAEYAILSLLRERFGLFMKAYTHPAKTAAGAMLGKAIVAAMGGRAPRISERTLEEMGDDELLSFLKYQKKKLPAKLAGMIGKRMLYKPAFRAQALDPSSRDVGEYESRRTQWRDRGFFSPELRSEHEARLAKDAGVNTDDVIVYCPPTAPGAKKVRHYVETQPGRELLRDEVYRPHLRVFREHLALWNAYIFVNPALDANAVSAVGEAGEHFLGLKNEVTMERRQLVLGLET